MQCENPILRRPTVHTDDAKPCQKHIKAVVFRGIQMKSRNRHVSNFLKRIYLSKHNFNLRIKQEHFSGKGLNKLETRIVDLNT